MYPKNGVAHRSCPDMVGFPAVYLQSVCPAYPLEVIRTWCHMRKYIKALRGCRYENFSRCLPFFVKMER